MTEKTIEARMKAIEDRQEEIKARLKHNSQYVIHQIMPLMDELREDFSDLWISNDRFLRLEESVADIAIIVYKQPNVKWPVDKMARPRRRHVRPH